MKRLKLFLTALLGVALFGWHMANAQNSHDDTSGGTPVPTITPKGPHGGPIQKIDTYFTEVVFQPKSVRVYFYDAQGQPVVMRGVTGSVSMVVKGNPKPYRYDLSAETADRSKSNSLYLAVDVSRVPDNSMSTFFTIQGLRTATGQALAFTQTFHLTGDSEQQAIARQKICPVSGKPLGAMGRPVKTTVNGRDVFVCCAGCVNALQTDPEKYLARLPQSQQADPAPAKATQADAAAIRRQQVCPVTGEALGGMGNPWKVYAKGQPLFVCCQGCIKKIQQNSDVYVAKVARMTNTTGSQRR